RIRLVNSNWNTFSGMGWDAAVVTADENSTWNTWETDTTNYPNLEGAGLLKNSVKFAGGEQVAGVSRMFGHDLRMGFEKAQGRLEFIDDFLGRPSPQWVQSIVSGGEIVMSSAFDGLSVPNSFMRRCTLDPK